ncbi:unnamed protein product [Durusdinium trenchii]|uniref:Fibronectin type-II domain-containing protein n=2 Tax=Durusdinium trenchii TaxID=1381693 RepID=A0ABP0SRD4_9DINO
MLTALMLIVPITAIRSSDEELSYGSCEHLTFSAYGTAEWTGWLKGARGGKATEMTWESCENLPKRTSCEFAYTYDGKHFVPCFWWNDLLKSENSLEPAPDLARCVASKPPLPAIEWELCSFRSERAKDGSEQVWKIRSSSSSSSSSRRRRRRRSRSHQLEGKGCHQRETRGECACRLGREVCELPLHLRHYWKMARLHKGCPGGRQDETMEEDPRLDDVLGMAEGHGKGMHVRDGWHPIIQRGGPSEDPHTEGYLQQEGLQLRFGR